MPRGFKTAYEETRAAYQSGRFTDKRKRSFIGRGPDGTLHELLAGEDKSRRHDEIMDASQGICQGCATAHYVGAMGEWDHRKGGLTARCDCLHNARWVCADFHRKRHVAVRWTRKPAAA